MLDAVIWHRVNRTRKHEWNGAKWVEKNYVKSQPYWNTSTLTSTYRWKAEMHRAQLNIAVRPIRMETKSQNEKKNTHGATFQVTWLIYALRHSNRSAWSSIKCAIFVCSTAFNLCRSSMVHRQAYSIKYSWSVCASKWFIDKITKKTRSHKKTITSNAICYALSLNQRLLISLCHAFSFSLIQSFCHFSLQIIYSFYSCPKKKARRVKNFVHDPRKRADKHNRLHIPFEESSKAPFFYFH